MPEPVQHVLNSEFVRLMLESCVSGSQFGTVTETEGKDKHVERARQNVLLVMPPGSGKTLLLSQIPGATYVSSRGLTFAGLVGSINEDGDFVPGACARAAGGVLAFDEFQRTTPDIKEAMNNILEGNPYNRNVGFPLRRDIRIKTKFLSIEGKAGSGELRTTSRFSTVCTGMYLPKKSVVDLAWSSRFAIIRFMPSLDFHFASLRGKNTFRLAPKKSRPVDFTFPDWLSFVDSFEDRFKKAPYFEYFASSPMEAGLVRRFAQELARLSCFFAFKADRTRIVREDWERALGYESALVHSYLFASLDERDLFILNNPQLNTQEIADALGIRRQSVEERMEKINLAMLTKIARIKVRHSQKDDVKKGDEPAGENPREEM